MPSFSIIIILFLLMLPSAQAEEIRRFDRAEITITDHQELLIYENKSRSALTGEDLGRSKYTEQVAINGIDIPGKNTPFSIEAYEAIKTLCSDQSVVLTQIRIDYSHDYFNGCLRTGNPPLIATVECNGTDVASYLIKKGYAKISQFYRSSLKETPYQSNLYELEQKAKAEKRGVWSIEVPLIKAPGIRHDF